MIDRKALAPLQLFQGVSSRAIDALAARGEEKSFGPNARIFTAGSQPRGWFIVLEGLVRVVRSGPSRQHVIHTEGPGGTLGEVPLFTNHTYPATAIAAEPTRCALLDRRALESAIAECPEIAFVLAKRLALRVETLVARLDERSSTSIRTRLIAFLLERSAAAPRGTFSLGMTQQALAEELGTVREVIVRELRRLRQAGLLAAAGGGRYRVPDRGALTRDG